MVAESLLELLLREKLVLDLRKHQQARVAVRLAVEQTLDQLSPKFDADLFQQECDIVYQDVFNSSCDDGRSVYS